MKLTLSALVIVLITATPACLRSDETAEESPQSLTELPTEAAEESSEESPSPSVASVTPIETRGPTHTIPPEERIEESPLATWDPSGVEAFAGEGFLGTLWISDGCVLVLGELQDTRILPIWPEPTSWNRSTQAIEFASPRSVDRNVPLQTGDRVELGGYVESATYSEFVIPPSPFCATQADTIVIVSDVVLISQD